MECPICYEAITAATGQTTMGCKHSFHFACIANWFYSQNENGLLESCPCCRHEALPIECLPKEDDSSESESSDSESLDSHNSHDYSAQFNAALFFINKGEELSNEDFQDYAATRIQAVVRAYRIRKAWLTYYHYRQQEGYYNNALRYASDNIIYVQRKRKFYEKPLQMSHPQWRSVCATKIQSVWRGFLTRNANKKMIGRLIISWIFKGDKWIRSSYTYEPLRGWKSGEGLPPQSLEFQQYSLAKRIQAVWRGYLVRRSV